MRWNGGGGETTYDCPRKAHANKQTTCSVCNKFAINVFFSEKLSFFSLVCVFLACFLLLGPLAVCSACRVTLKLRLARLFPRLSVSFFPFDVILAKFLDSWHSFYFAF